MPIYLPHLKTFKRLKKYLPHFQDEKERPELKGGYNRIFFGYANVLVTTDNDAKGVDLPIAALHHRHDNTDFFYAIHLLRNLNKYKEEKESGLTQSFSSPFIQRLLYVGERGKISVRADIDFFYFFKKLKKSKTNKIIIHGKPAWIDIKEIVAQLILAVQSLHVHGLVHRDIKLENFLVTIDDLGNVSIELADLDTIAKAADTSLKHVGTLEFFPNPFQNLMKQALKVLAYTGKFNAKTIDEAYQKVDKTFFDCYALGLTLNEIANFFPGINDETRYALKELAYSLRYTNNLQQTVMKHNFFGKTPEERLAYLDAVHAKFTQLKQTIFYDTYYQSTPSYYPETEDTFWLLPKYLKDIYAIAENLENQITFFNDNLLEEKNNDIHVHLSIQHKGKKLIQLIENAFSLIPPPSNLEINLLESLKKDANHILQSIEISLALPIKIIVAETVENYKKIINNYNRSFYQKLRHGYTGLQHANHLLSELDDYSNSTSVLEKLSVHLQHGPGNWDKTSFKTLLKNNLIKNGLVVHDQEISCLPHFRASIPPPPL